MSLEIHNAQMITKLQEKHGPQGVSVVHVPTHPAFCLMARGFCNEQDFLQLLPPPAPAWGFQGFHEVRCPW